MPCPSCGREHKRGKNNLCAACYKRAYYKTEKGKKAVDRANKKDITKNPERRFAAVVRYREKVGYYVPTELHELHAAIKRLDRTVEAAHKRAGVCEPSQRRSQQSAQRHNRFGRGAYLLGAGARRRPGAKQRSNAEPLPEDGA